MKKFRLGRASLLSVIVGSLCGGILLAAVLSFRNTASVTVPEVSAGAEISSSILNFIPIEATPVAEPVEVVAPAATPKVSGTSSSPLGSEEAVGLPLSLEIPIIHLHVRIQAVGFAPSGAVGIPNNYTDVAWFKYGVAPGQVGNATMNGHVVTHSFGAGVFTDLHTLVVGDEVDVDTATGAHLVFRVTKVAVYDVDEAPTEEIFGPTSKRMLNLITCDGAWVQTRKMYNQRLVVYTELVQ